MTKFMKVVITAIIFVIILLAIVFMPSKDREQIKNNQDPEQNQNSAKINEEVKRNIKHLRDLSEKYPDNPKISLELAHLYQDSHNMVDAIAYYEKVLVLEPLNDSARIDYALCLYEKGKQKESLEQNLIIVKKNPENIMALFNIGSIYANWDSINLAKKYWGEVVLKSPESEISKNAKANLSKLNINK